MVELIKTNLDSEDYGQWEKDTAKCLFFSIMTFLGDHDIFSLMKNIAISTLSLQILLAKDFVDNLRWKSMIWTLNERVAERSWRSFGF